MEPNFGRNTYISHSICLTSIVSNVRPMNKRNDTSVEANSYIAMFESIWPLRSGRLSKITCYKVRDKIMEEQKLYFKPICIDVQTSHEYAPHSPLVAEWNIQENWAREGTLLVASNLPTNLCGEAIHRVNGLRNRSPTSRFKTEMFRSSNVTRTWRSISRTYFRLERGISNSSADIWRQ